MVRKKDTPVPTAQCKPGSLVTAGVKVLLAILCAGIGGYLLSLTLDTVSIFGEGLGSDARSQQLYARIHVAVHLFGTLSAVLIPVFLASGKGYSPPSPFFSWCCVVAMAS